MPGLVPNLSKQSHLDAVEFKATAELAGDLCLRGLRATTDALGLALQNSLENQESILSEQGKSMEERGRLLHAEGKREHWFRDFGPAQHLVACTVLTYATLDTVLGRAVRLLEIHASIPAPKQNPHGSSVRQNLGRLRETMPDLPPLSCRDRVVLDEFSKIRIILIHQGYFVNEADPRIAELRASENHGDYFEIQPGFPIILREYGVRHFVEICKGLIGRVAEGVYRRLLSN